MCCSNSWRGWSGPRSWWYLIYPFCCCCFLLPVFLNFEPSLIYLHMPKSCPAKSVKVFINCISSMCSSLECIVGCRAATWTTAELPCDRASCQACKFQMHTLQLVCLKICAVFPLFFWKFIYQSKHVHSGNMFSMCNQLADVWGECAQCLFFVFQKCSSGLLFLVFSPWQGLTLFNFDMIRKGGSGNCYYVIDINYFPGM